MTDFGFFQSTTADPPTGALLLRVVAEDDHFEVTDFVGLRFGFAPDLAGALAGWHEQVTDIISIPDEQLGEPLKSEVAGYRKALRLTA